MAFSVNVLCVLELDLFDILVQCVWAREYDFKKDKNEFQQF